MNTADNLFHQIVSEISTGSEGNFFGTKCIKATNGKTAAFLWKDAMVFKLPEKLQHEALSLDGASVGSHIYAPDKPLKGWVSVPMAHSQSWEKFITAAIKHVMV